MTDKAPDGGGAPGGAITSRAPGGATSRAPGGAITSRAPGGATGAGWTLAAVALINPVFGTLYCWSLFLAPLESALTVGRTEMSAVFSTAVGAFVLGSVAMPRLYGRVPPWLLLVLPAVAMVAGLALAAGARGTLLLLLGYGLLFGIASGAGYNLMAQLAVSALPTRPGLASGLATAGFAIGGALYSLPLRALIADLGPLQTFAAMAAATALIALAALACVARGGLVLDRPAAADSASRGPALFERPFPLIWLAFAGAAFAGVMTIGHAKTIVTGAGGAEMLAVGTVVAINLLNALGRVGAGALVDRLPPGRIGALAHLVALAGFALLLSVAHPLAAAGGAALQGLAYGLASGGYPAALSHYFGIARFGLFFGLVMTAWGFAGLAGPMIAGALYDLSGDYTGAALAGGTAALLALVIASRLPRPGHG